MNYLIARDGVPVARFATEDKAYAGLLRMQGMSTDPRPRGIDGHWAIRYEGWSIVAPWDNETANKLRDTAARLLTDHGHNLSDRDPLTRENCGACALDGYKATKADGPNYAGWERVYAQIGKQVPRFMAAFDSTPARNADNPTYVAAWLKDLATFGTPAGSRLPV